MQKLSPQSTRREELSKLPFKESYPTPEAFSVGYLSMASIVCSSAAGEVRNRPV